MTCRLATLCLFMVIFARPILGADELAAAGVKRFNQAYQAWSCDEFAAAVDLFRQATLRAPESSVGYYWLGTAQFHLMLQLLNPPTPATREQQEAGRAAMDAAVQALQRAAKLDAKNAEVHALLGTLYGMKIDGSLARAAWFGPRIDKHRKAALRWGTENPRVQYLLGMCQFHTAKKETAWRETLATLRTAERLFVAEATQPSGPLDPRWGHSSCLTFIGRTYEQLGHPIEAADCFRRALAHHPSDHLAKAGLRRVEGPK